MWQRFASVPVLACLASVSWCTAALGQADEAKIRTDRTVYAAPAALGSGTGTDAANAARLADALASVRNDAVRVVLLDGVYRDYYDVPPGPAPLSLEAQNAGRAVISGSDEFDNWTGPDAHGVWAAPWRHDWLPVHNFYFPGERTTAMKRRELVFVDGRRMAQRVDPEHAEKPVDAGALRDGEFTVDEAADRLLLKPPAGVADPNAAVTEVSVRGARPAPKGGDDFPIGQSLMRIAARSGLRLKGLVFRHSANWVRFHPAVSIHHAGSVGGPDSWPRDLVIEDCRFEQNNSIGLEFSSFRGVTIRRCAFNDNGSRGAGHGQARDVVLENCEFRRNGWRFAPWINGHDSAGYKIFDGADSDSWFKGRSENTRFTRCTFTDNQCLDVWQDFGGPNLVIEHCLFQDTKFTSIMQEISPGPMRVSGCVFRRSGGGGYSGGTVLVVGSPDVTFTRCTFYGAAGTEGQKDVAVFSLVNDTRKINDGFSGRVERFTLSDSVVQAAVPGTWLFRTGSWNGAPAARVDLADTGTLTGNAFFNADRPLEGGPYATGATAFYSNHLTNDWRDAYPDLTFDAWRQLKPTNATSRWAQVPAALLDPLEPVHGEARPELPGR